MHKRFVINVVSRVLLVVSLLMSLPLGWALVDDHTSAESQAFKFSILIGIIFSFILRILFRFEKEESKRLNPKDGLAIVGFSWLALSAIGALPLLLSGVTETYTDALFEIASGFTTTGATIFTDIESLPRGILFWRSLTHWLGGMGIIVLYIALLPALGVKTSQLYKAEAPGITVERVEPRIKDTAKNLWGIYFFLTIAETLLLKFGGMSYFDALCHTFGTVATGGFSTYNDSAISLSPYIQWVTIVFMFLAGTNFVLHFQAFRGKPLAYFRDEEFRWYFLFILILILVFTYFLSFSEISTAPLRDSAFQIIAIITTTGFVSVDFDLWPELLRFILVMLMFIGGCGGSTGGGMKFIRVFLSVKIAFRSVINTAFPNLVFPIKFNKSPLNEKLVNTIAAYFMIYFHLFFLGAILILFLEKCDLDTAFTASVSALSNIGPGLGKIGATQNFAWMSNPGKWLITFLMIAGRLELYAILILFVPSTWKK